MPSICPSIVTKQQHFFSTPIPSSSSSSSSSSTLFERTFLYIFGRTNFVMARRKKKKEPRTVSYKLFIRRVLRKVQQPGIELSKTSLKIIDSFVSDLLDRIATKATLLAHYDRRKTVTLHDMDYASRLVLPDQMAKRANVKAKEVVDRFYAAKVRDRMNRTNARRGGM